MEKLQKLIEALDFDDGEAEELDLLLSAAHRSGWWAQYRGLISEDFEEFLGLEDGAETIHIYEGKTITGLLQTESYAEEVIQAAPDISLTDLQKILDIRLRRQRVLSSDTPPNISIIMNEASLLQHYGASSVLKDQLTHIVDLVETEPTWLKIHIQPFDRTPLGFSAASTVVLFDFATPQMPSAVWLEAVDPVGTIFDEEQVARIALNFKQALRSSLDSADSLALIRSHLRGLES